MTTHADLIENNKAAGVLCKSCGTFIGTAGKGKPRDCDPCLAITAEIELREAEGEALKKMLAERECPHCGKVLRSKAGRDQHVRMVHS